MKNQGKDLQLVKQRKRRRIKENLEAFAYLSPAMTILFIFLFIPVVYALGLSMHRGNPIDGFRFIGLTNYISILGSDIDFYKAVVNTLYYCLFSIPTQIVIGIGLAMLLNRAIKGIGFFRTVYFIPHITSLVAVAMIWKWIFNEEFGLVNYLITAMDIEKVRWFNDPEGIIQKMMQYFPIEMIKSYYMSLTHCVDSSAHPMWKRIFGYALRGPSLAMFTIVSLSVWKVIGYTVIIFLAGLQNINDSYYEAAEIDGANKWHQFRNITWPLLSPTTFFILIISFIAAFKVFVPMMMMTNGQPENTTVSVVYYLYQQAWTADRMGKASAIAYILFSIILIITIIQNKIIGKKVHYDS